MRTQFRDSDIQACRRGINISLRESLLHGGFSPPTPIGKEEKLRFKKLVVITLCMAIVTVIAIVYMKSTAPPVGRQEETARKMFGLHETEPSEPYFELVDPLDNWTAQAIQDLTQSVFVYEQYWNQCQITNSNATVFKYGQEFYTIDGMVTARIVHIHVDPLRETGCGIGISLRKATYSPNKTCYELNDPLDPWTEAALQDLINIVEVDDIYHDRCALTKPGSTNIEQRPIFKYNDEYYALDLFAFYDSFGRVPTMEIITVAWIVLGLLWLGSGIHAVKKTRDARHRLASSES